MGDKVADVTLLARAMLDDVPAAVFTDDVLLPFLNLVYGSLQKRLAEKGHSYNVKHTDLALAASIVQLDSASTPALPTDFLHPIRLWERLTTGSSTDLKQLSKVRHGIPPEYAQSATSLGVWEFRNNKIFLVGSSAAMTVRLRYEAEFSDLTLISPNDEIKIPGASEALAFGTAALAARSRGVADLTGDLKSEYMNEMKQIINRDTLSERAKLTPAPPGPQG